MDTNDTQLALNVILSTAASMGVDVDLLCHAAAEELLDADFLEAEERLVNRAVFIIEASLERIVDPS